MLTDQCRGEAEVKEISFESVERMFEQIKDYKVLRVRRSGALRDEGYILRAGRTEVMLIPNSWVDRVPALARLEITQQEFERFLDTWVLQYQGPLNPPPRGVLSQPKRGETDDRQD